MQSFAIDGLDATLYLMQDSGGTPKLQQVEIYVEPEQLMQLTSRALPTSLKKSAFSIGKLSSASRMFAGSSDKTK